MKSFDNIIPCPLCNETGKVAIGRNGRGTVLMPSDFELHLIIIWPVTLPEKSILMVTVIIVKNLLMRPWEQTLSHDRFVWEEYEDISIRFNPHPTRQVNYALWSFYFAMASIGAISVVDL